MAKTYVQPGQIVTCTAPTGGVTGGTPLKIGQLFGVPQQTAAEGVEFDLMVTGVHDIPKVGTQAWTEGALIYWDDATGHNYATTTATGSLLIGVAVKPVPGSGAGETTGRVRLNGCARADEA